MSKTISIILGSDSDLGLVKKCTDVLELLNIEFSTRILSAHRTPDLLEEHVSECEKGETKVYIAFAGLAAHLAGAIASKTIKPVIGVPVDAGPLSGFDALLSTVQMPKGIPVATVAIGSAGSANAAFLAAQILSLSSDEVANKLNEIRLENRVVIKKKNSELA
ncbi:MAG: 5-(carboxyamino)imidazole ribonucleotide mutase [SAR86 cluster bacterium]|jgi:5-(carboxyamino)imidazole ribonucleotide mutase|nr:5-(carboxyamino)imidazole ribonucleotide mutase [SAR86 cluster bacterium]